MDKEKRIAYRVSVNTIIGNAVLCVFKIICGIFGGSQALISDGIHSASDIFSTIIVIIGVKISHKASDDEHRYGHERYECLAAVLLAFILALTSIFIGYTGLNSIFTGEYKRVSPPALITLIAAGVSIITKEIMFHYTMAAAKKINSDSLKADAWHHRSDAFSSIGSLVGIGCAMLGLPIMDPIASIIICIVILKAAYSIVKESIGKLVDKSCDREIIEGMEKAIAETRGVLGIDDIKTRMFGSKIYADIEICCDGKQTLFEAHQIAEQVHDKIEDEFPRVKHCMVHVNPG